MNTQSSQNKQRMQEDTHLTSSLLQLTPVSRTMNSSATLVMNETVAQRQAAGHTTLHLGFGEASFPLHPLLKAALVAATTHTGYAPVLGLAPLRQAIAQYLTRTRGLLTTANHIAVAPGSKPLLYALLNVLEGDLLLPVPSWVSYAAQARLAGKRIIPVPTASEDHHRLTPHILSERMAAAQQDGAQPRILLVNSPSNPTGSMFDRADVEALALWAREAGITLISDEIYAELAHGWREHISPAHFYPEGCIVTGGLSKAFSAGGWRLGYAAVPANEAGTQLMASLRAFASEVWSSAATPIQEAAITAFTPESGITTYVHQAARLHGYVTRKLYHTLIGLGIPCPRPAGGFYLYPDFAPWRSALLTQGIKTSKQLASSLLEDWNIATLPGTAFGEPPEALRLRLATSMLYNTGHKSAQEQEQALWQLLDQADTLPTDGQEETSTLSLPLLEQVQERMTALINSLGAAK